MTEEAHVELRFRPDVELVSVVRRFVSAFSDEVLDDAERASRLAVAAHELVENGVKYSLDGETALRLVISPDETGAKLAIGTWNRARPGDVDGIQRVFAEMQEHPDPQDFYQLLMRRNARAPDLSGLGLARIRAETDMTLRCEVKDDEVSVLAESRIAGWKEQG